MSAISDAANLPRLPDSTNTFADVANANAVADEGIQTVTDNAQQEKAQQVQQAPFSSITHKFNPKTGKYDVSVAMAGDTFDYLGSLLQTGQATISAFEQARAKVAAKRQFQEQNPILSAVGKIASTAAAQYGSGYPAPRGRDISPIVRAAGAYGLEQFGETTSDLAQQEAQLQGQAFGVARSLYGEKQQDQVIKSAEARSDRQEANDQNRFALGFVGQLRQGGREAAYTNENIPGLVDQLVKSGAATSPETALSMAKGIVAESQAIERVRKAEAKDKADADTLRQLAIDRRFLAAQEGMNNRMAASLNRRDQKAVDDEADMLLLAQGAVNGDPTSLNIYSTRTGGRAKFLAMVKRIDPSMTEAKLNARAKAVMDLGDRSKNGTLGTQMEMFDTFIQHTDELERVAGDMKLTNSPLLNKGLNTLRSEVMGDPRLQRLLVVAAAAGKEYEGVLLRGRALYASDREEIDKFLSSKLTLKQILAAAQEQRQVTAARIRSGNNSFKRTVGKDLPPDSLSEESKAILRRNKIDLPFLKDESTTIDPTRDLVELERGPDGKLRPKQ